MANTGKIILQVVNGAREPFTGNILVRLFDGNKQKVVETTRRGPTILFDKIPCFDNSRDDYTVLASANGMVQAGYFPARVAPNVLRPVFLMLMPKDGGFNFNGAHWDDIAASHTDTHAILGFDTKSSSHENDDAPKGWVSVEPDMDYFQDIGGHAIIEVLHNTLTGKMSDPRTIYALRWIAGMQAGIPEFNPPYTVV